MGRALQQDGAGGLQQDLVGQQADHQVPERHTHQTVLAAIGRVQQEHVGAVLRLGVLAGLQHGRPLAVQQEHLDGGGDRGQPQVSLRGQSSVATGQFYHCVILGHSRCARSIVSKQAEI